MRKYTNYLLEAMEEGLFTGEQIAEMALKYMSEDDVRDMCLANDIDLAEEDYDGQPDWEQEWHDFGERYSDEYDAAF